MKPYPEYKETGLDWLPEVPAHWEVKRLKYVCTFVYGEALPSTARSENEPTVPVFGSNGQVGFHDVAITRSPCIIVGRKGSFGKINWSDEPCFPIDTTYFIDERFTTANLKFLFFLLKTLNLDALSQDTGVPGLSREMAYQKVVAVPPLEEQRTIVEYLIAKNREIESYIAAKQLMIERMKELKAAIISDAVTGRLILDKARKPSGVAWLGDVPKHWEVKKLRWCASLKSGDSITSESIEEEGEFPVYGGNGFRGYASSFTHDGYYPLIGRQGALCGNINYASGKFFASEHAVVVTPRPFILTFYLGELLRAMNLNQYSLAAAQPGLSVEAISRLKIPVPPLEEQRAIVAFIESQLGTIQEAQARIEREIELARELWTTLVAEVVTGKVDVSDWDGPDDIPAANLAIEALETGETAAEEWATAPEWEG